MKVTSEQIYECLRQVMDPELQVNIVDLGLIYEVSVTNQDPEAGTQDIYIKMTLTSPGCPLAGMFDDLVKDSLVQLEGIDVDRDVQIELTFDPPWVPEMMTEEVRAELGMEDYY